jgi:hypothetical protein
VHKFPDFAVVSEGGADKVARGVRAVVGVGKGEAGKHTYKPNDGQFVGERVEGNGGG